jgi:hypothetical protein
MNGFPAILRLMLVLASVLSAQCASAQMFPSVGGRGPLPSGVEPGSAALYLSATLSASDAQPVRGGLKWRVFEEQAQPDGSHKIVAESSDPAPQFTLPDGGYVVHAAFGLAGASKRLSLKGQTVSERVVLNAGALKIDGMLGDTPIPPQRLSISLFVPERGNSEAKLVLEKGRPGDIVCLPEGSYHIVSTLLDVASSAPGASANPTNSVVTTDLRVQAGKITEATLKHRAATMTLKLVNAPGGEALANTNFSVLTPGGDVIRELIGAFPALVLAEGEYVAIARHDGKTYQSPFKVQSTLDRDVEVVAK